jgi:hypothetical protein
LVTTFLLWGEAPSSTFQRGWPLPHIGNHFGSASTATQRTRSYNPCQAAGFSSIALNSTTTRRPRTAASTRGWPLPHIGNHFGSASTATRETRVYNPLQAAGFPASHSTLLPRGGQEPPRPRYYSDFYLYHRGCLSVPLSRICPPGTEFTGRTTPTNSPLWREAPLPTFQRGWTSPQIGNHFGSASTATQKTRVYNPCQAAGFSSIALNFTTTRRPRTAAFMVLFHSILVSPRFSVRPSLSNLSPGDRVRRRESTIARNPGKGYRPPRGPIRIQNHCLAASASRSMHLVREQPTASGLVLKTPGLPGEKGCRLKLTI